MTDGVTLFLGLLVPVGISFAPILLFFLFWDLIYFQSLMRLLRLPFTVADVAFLLLSSACRYLLCRFCMV